MPTECSIDQVIIPEPIVKFHQFNLKPHIHVVVSDIDSIDSLQALVDPNIERTFVLKKDKTALMTKTIFVQLVELRLNDIFIVCKVKE